MTVQEKHPYDVFISYSHADRDWVRKELLTQLETAGLKVIIDHRDFEIGVSRIDNIEHAVEASRHTVIVLTPTWVESEWALFEGILTRTSDIVARTRRLVPLILEPCRPPANIAILHAADFTDPATRTEEMARLLGTLGARKARIFISYRRDAEPDEPIALQVAGALKGQHYVSIDQVIPVGKHWPEWIAEELRQADFLITFLSAGSVISEMVAQEIELAHQFASEQEGRPAILPVRLAYREPFPYSLKAYLDHIHWAFWEGPNDTVALIAELRRAIAGGALPIGTPRSKQRLLQDSDRSILPPPLPQAQPVPLETADDGMMDLQSLFYVKRAADSDALMAIQRSGVTITIKGPRQMGKSSLLLRTIDMAEKVGKRVAFLDFQLMETPMLSSLETFLRWFCASISSELQIENRVEEYWDKRKQLSNNECCTNYIEQCVLKQRDDRIVLAMDEVDKLFEADFRSDFFSMLRAWHGKRSRKPIWKRLDLVLVTSTEPYQLIADLTRSPFNVGERIVLEDFTTEQIADLNQRHQRPLNQTEERKLLELVGGHPYLVRRALYLIANGSSSFTNLCARATENRGPFGDHLRYHLFRLYDHAQLVEGMLQVIHEGACGDEQIFYRLQAAGLVRGDRRTAEPRCHLYADYFREHLQ